MWEGFQHQQVILLQVEADKGGVATRFTGYFMEYLKAGYISVLRKFVEVSVRCS
jgi:hypothetical protein